MLITLTDATSKAGEALADRLRAAGMSVRGTTRLLPDAPSRQAGSGMVPVDFLQPGTLPAAFEGADAAVLVPPLEVSLLEMTRNLVAAAEGAGVRRIVLISYLQAGNRLGGALLEMHGRAEEVVEGSPAASTCLRPNFYMQNFLNPHRPIATSSRGAISFIDARDLADVVLAVLSESGHEGKTYSLTGPRAYSVSDVLHLFEQQACPPSGSPGLSWDKICLPYRRSGHAASEQAFCDLWLAADEGLFSAVSPELELLTGRTGRSFEDFIRDHCVSGVRESAA